jgi:uncharacterized protein (DUF1499 family)
MKANKIIAGIIIALVLLASSPFTREYPDLQPQRFNQPFDKVFDAALSATRAMGWDLREANRDQGVIEAIAATRILKSKDDVTLTLTREGGDVVVNVRSKSRWGKSDFGMNARRIRAVQAQLANNLAKNL